METRYLLVALILLSSWSVQPLAAQQSQDKRTQIDGRKEPEKIPLWFQWQTLLTRSSETVEAREPESVGVAKNVLFVMRRDVELVRKEGDAHKRRREELEAATKVLVDTFDRQGKTPAQVLSAMHGETFNLELQYRNAVLQARDRILAEASPEGAIAIEAWLATVVVPGTKLFLHELDAKTFALPR